jgi:hypothetical protein
MKGNGMHDMLDLTMNEVESLDAPALGEWLAGIGAGLVVGAGALYLGVVIAGSVAIT